MDGVLFKFDFGKAYDQVKLVVSATNFSNERFCTCKWAAKLVQGESVGICMSDNIGHFFQTLKREDMLSPLLFNLVADILNTICCCIVLSTYLYVYLTY